MTTPNPDAEVIEKLAKELSTLFYGQPSNPGSLDKMRFEELSRHVLLREQAAVNAAIKECSETVINEPMGPYFSRLILAKLK